MYDAEPDGCRSAFTLPPLLLVCFIGALFYRSALCAAFVTLTMAAWLLPPGKVSTFPGISHTTLDCPLGKLGSSRWGALQIDA